MLFSFSLKNPYANSLKEKKTGQFTVIYSPVDETRLPNYVKLFEGGQAQVQKFFKQKFPATYKVFIHPNRKSLDSTWQQNWRMPDFKSECWMVASGVSDRFDLLSFSAWETEACDHNANQEEETARLIAHELTHVFHGQKNHSPDFSNTEGIDWFIEGLATYVSGQCDSIRMIGVKKSVTDKTEPKALDDFWTGKLKYGYSGSLVKFIDIHFGRKKLISLLPFSKKQEILFQLSTTEAQLLEGWRNWVMGEPINNKGK